ncbi:HD-GYP domain-containing protein [Brevibacillus centrosporus]|uniref:HD-GYP domain-containing protein n=1 Tax=Brevibacillus centrosporus TaxID=54910 RepID=UPI003B025E31
MALYHHERLNGSGYQSGLTGDTIPISAKIIAVADVYDAMTADRSYRSALTHEKAMRHLLDNIDVLYDRNVIQTFREAIEDNSRNLYDKNFSEDVPRMERRCAE